MFQIYIGSAPGCNDSILPKNTRQEADDEARRVVMKALQEGQALIASVFDPAAGVVVGGFATDNLRNKTKKFPQITLLSTTYDSI